jgi:hypothetical protein
VYNSRQSCVDCTNSPIEGAECRSIGDEHRWVYEGNIDTEFFQVGVPLTVIGNVTTFTLSVRRFLEVQGCILQREGVYGTYRYLAPVDIDGFRASPITIVQRGVCGWPKISVRYLPKVAFPELGEEFTCDSVYIKYNDSYITKTNDTISIFIPDEAFECVSNAGFFVALILPIVLGTAGIILGIVFGVRRYRQKKRAKQLDLQMEEQAKDIDPVEHCSEEDQ